MAERVSDIDVQRIIDGRKVAAHISECWAITAKNLARDLFDARKALIDAERRFERELEKTVKDKDREIAAAIRDADDWE